ncbi:hypothetical protein CAPTEDRAFT_216024 [Capitella teleta]|uniref:CARD domain-containing protein n=1 Tax=Capitella teleta TaxID=283909 RepID=R7TRF5_CAPTE|nr:hypothetical protein CAPTEDRAFT_216024 [Capitella teleta]|eukprot:ELT96493.1 hypothetical protein CAPTEDRAFT_216024 [Capitella teleta]
MDESDRMLLNDYMVDLVKDLNPPALYAYLLHNGILSQDDVQLIDAELIRRDKAIKLMSIIPRKGPEAFAVFVASLEKTHPHLHQMLSGVTRTAPDDVVFDDVQRMLKQYYSSCLNEIYTIPWLQELPLDLAKVYVRLRLQTTGQMQKEQEEVTQDEIFTSRLSSGNSTRILIEGDPGIGKSTLMQKLAFDWSSSACAELCCSPCIHSFDLVVYLTAANLQGQPSTQSLIHAHLLPKDSQISVHTLRKTLRNRNILYLIDAYDEGFTENQLLFDLIQGRVALQKSTVVLTSRPNYLRELLKCFGTRLCIEGFNAQQRLDYVEKFAQHLERPVDDFQLLLQEDSHFTDLCCTPLNMAIVCMMSALDDASIDTRTDLYLLVHTFIVKRASDRLGLSCKDVERTIIDPLCKMSFEAIMKGEAVLVERNFKDDYSDPEKFCQVGYLIKKLKVSRLCCEVRFSFSHRSFQEFLSALFIKQLSEAERQQWLNSVDLEQNESIISFLFGLLNEEDLLSMSSTLMDETLFSFVDLFHISSIPWACPESHLFKRCLLELKTVPPTLKDVIKRNCPSEITLHYECSSNCMKSITHLLSLSNFAPNSISFVLSHCEWMYPSMFDDVISMLRILRQCKSVGRVTLVRPPADRLGRFLEAMRIGQRESSIQCINIHAPKDSDTDMKSVMFDAEAFGEHTRGMELYSYDDRSVCAFLKAAQNKPLTTFGITNAGHWSKLNDECVELMSTAMKTTDLQNVVIGRTRARHVISLLAEQHNLRSLDINVHTMKKDDWMDFGRVLHRQRLQKLTLRECDFSRYVCDALSLNLETMNTLNIICLHRGSTNDINGFAGVLSAVHHLQTLIIHGVEFGYEDVDIICKVLQKLPALVTLSFDISYKPVGPCKSGPEQQTYFQNIRTVSNKKFVKAIAQCKHLKVLSLCDFYAPINDDLVEDLCNAVKLMEQLRYLSLPENRFTDIGRTQIINCLNLKPGKRILFKEE